MLFFLIISIKDNILNYRDKHEETKLPIAYGLMTFNIIVVLNH